MSDYSNNASGGLAPKAYWDDNYARLNLKRVRPNDVIARFLNQQLRPVSNKSALEIGCYPGRYQPVLGELGYRLNGIDLSGDLARLRSWLAGDGFDVGEFLEVDLFDFDPGTTFDLVFSAGFVEHFEDFETVICKHAALTAPNGTLVITAPNFAGLVQRLLHRTLDPDNLARHYLPSMSPRIWSRVLASQGFTVRFAGYFGGFDFWHENKSPGRLQNLAIRVLRKITPAERMPSLSAWAPHIVLIAHRLA